MDYIIKRIDENKAAMEMENGSKVIIIFKKEDNPDIEDIVEIAYRDNQKSVYWKKRW